MKFYIVDNAMYKMYFRGKVASQTKCTLEKLKCFKDTTSVAVIVLYQ